MFRAPRRLAPTALRFGVGTALGLGSMGSLILGLGGALGCESSGPTDSASSGGSGNSGGTEASGAARGDGGTANSGGTPGAGGGGLGGESSWASLREAAFAAGKYVGTAVSIDALRDDETYAALLKQEFDEVTPENAMKWEPLAQAADTYDWVDADELVEAAEASGQTIKGHTLVWHQQYPSWLSPSMTPEELRSAIESHITATMTRYRGRIRAWDVVNEAVDVGSASGYTESIFYEILGPSYIADAFRFARDADPDALLFYNEVGIERRGAKSDFTYEVISELLADGVPIDGIGFQSHVSIHRYPSLQNLRANLARFAALGLRVNLSEIDARTLLLPGDQALRWQVQRIAMQQLTAACVLEPACEGVTFWGFTDNYSWINDEGQDDNPLLFDRGYQKKPAYQGALDGLSGLSPVVGESVLVNGDFSEGSDGWAASDADLTTGTEAGGACAQNRAGEGSGIVQFDLADALAEGPYAFASEVRVGGVDAAVVDATLVLEFESGMIEAFNIATVPAAPGEWTELSGYLGLGFAEPLLGAELSFDGPPGGIDLCVRDVSLGRVTSE